MKFCFFILFSIVSCATGFSDMGTMREMMRKDLEIDRFRSEADQKAREVRRMTLWESERGFEEDSKRLLEFARQKELEALDRKSRVLTGLSDWNPGLKASRKN